MKADDPMTAETIFPKWMEDRVARQEELLELSQDEGDSLAVFLAMDTQWQRHAMTGLRLGLDYARIEPTARMLKIEMTPRRFLDLRIMEDGALAQFAKAAK